MRKLTTLSEEHARIFCDYLSANQIEYQEITEEIIEDSSAENNQIQNSGTKKIAIEIWIKSDFDLKHADALLKETFILEKQQEIFKKIAESKEAKIIKVDFQQKKPKNLNRKTQAIYLTDYIIAFCVGLFILQLFDSRNLIRQYLWFSTNPLDMYFGMKNFDQIAHGQVWRLISPIFLHADIFHIGFNMMWLFQIGRVIEEFTSKTAYALLIIITAIISNCVFYLAAGPAFEGFSGVIYGMIGFLWIIDKFHRNPPMSVDHGMFRFLLGWYVFCWILTALGFRVANSIHGFGAFSGCIFAFLYLIKIKRLKKIKIELNQQTFFTFLVVLILLGGSIYTDATFYQGGLLR